MQYCRITQSILRKKPMITCSTVDDEIIIALFAVIISFIIYLAIKVSKIPVSSPKKDETKQCRSNDEQEKQEESVKSDGSTISPRKSDCSSKSKESSKTPIQSVLPTSSEVKSKKEAEDVEETCQQIDMKFVNMRKTRSGNFENDILVNYCLVDNFDRFGILNKVGSGSSSSNEMTTDGDMGGENSEEEEEESGDNYSEVSHGSHGLISYEKLIEKQNSYHETEDLSSVERNLKDSREAADLKVSKVQNNLTVCESTLALSDKNSTASFSFSQFYLSDDSTQSFEKIKTSSLQKVKKWNVAPRPSLTISKKAIFLRPQKKTNPIKVVSSQILNKSKISTEKSQTKATGNGKIQSSLDIHAKHSNSSTDNKKLVKLRPHIIKTIEKTMFDRTPINYIGGAQRLSECSAPSENQQMSMVENVLGQEIRNTSSNPVFEEEVIRSGAEKKCMDKIINLTKNLEDCDKNLALCEDPQEFSNVHQSPSDDNSEKVKEMSFKGFEEQPIYSRAFFSSNTCDSSKQELPVNFPEDSENDVMLLRSEILSKVRECDEPLLPSRSAFKEEVIRNGVVRECKDKFINLTKNLEDCDKNVVSCEYPLKCPIKQQSPDGDYSDKVKRKSCRFEKDQPISLGAFMGTCGLRKQSLPENVPENLKNEADLLRSRIYSKMEECDKLLLKLTRKGETFKAGSDSLKNLKRKVSESRDEPQNVIINEIEEKRKKESTRTPSNERNSLVSFIECATSYSGKTDKNISEKNHQEVQDLNKSKIVTNILNSLSKTKDFTNVLEENIHATRKREDKIENDFSNQVTALNSKKLLEKVDNNGNLSDIKANETKESFAGVHKYRKNFSHPLGFSTSPIKLSKQQCFQTIVERFSSEEDCRSDEEKRKCRRTTLCKGECRC